MLQKKQSLRLAARALVLTAALSLCLVSPALAANDAHGQHDEAPGPMPIAVLGSVFGAAFWVASAPFCLLFSPKHIGDSFDLLVMAPLRVAVGAEAP